MASVDQLKTRISVLEETLSEYDRKIEEQIATAKEFIRNNQRDQARLCLVKKKALEIERTNDEQEMLTLMTQLSDLEFANIAEKLTPVVKESAQTVSSLRESLKIAKDNPMAADDEGLPGVMRALQDQIEALEVKGQEISKKLEAAADTLQREEAKSTGVSLRDSIITQLSGIESAAKTMQLYQNQLNLNDKKLNSLYAISLQVENAATDEAAKDALKQAARLINHLSGRDQSESRFPPTFIIVPFAVACVVLLTAHIRGEGAN